MTIIEKESGCIPAVLKENLPLKNVSFVFATSVALDSWTEWCVKKPAESGVKAVALNRFIAWDKFKEKYINATEPSKHAVPSLLRKFFIQDIIRQNAESAAKGTPLFKSIINPSYAEEAYSFTNWLSSVLPELDKWYRRLAEVNGGKIVPADDEDKDYLLLYEKYREFLGDSMFEPAWVMPDFSDSDRQFIILYPEQIEDFDDYHSILDKCSNITVYKLPSTMQKQPEVICYPDSRMELRRTALSIRQLYESGVEYDEIAVHIPDIETWRPYISREFTNYCIPFVVRAGEGLTKNSAGSIFEDVYSCIQNDFSFDSVRALLLNANVPWKNPEINEALVKTSNALHCVCNYEKGRQGDVLIKALYKKGEPGKSLLDYYSKLRIAVENIVNAESFKKVLSGWFAFRSSFLSEDFSKEADNILGRCISELEELAELEEEFLVPMNLTVNSAYAFFLNELRNKKYKAQEKLKGVNIFEYKLACAGAYRYNYVIDCSQNSVNVSFNPLSFLNRQKRALLGIKNSDSASGAILRHYGKFNSENSETTFYSYSENTFNGFAIPHNFLLNSGRTRFDELDNSDFIKNERLSYIEGKPLPEKLTERQISQFFNWKDTADYKANRSGTFSENYNAVLQNKLTEVLKEKRSNREPSATSADGPFFITQSDLKNFFPCPRRWLFKNLFRIKSDTLETSLFNPRDAGNLYHKILELFMGQLDVLPVLEADETFGDREKDVLSLIDRCIKNAVFSPELHFCDSPLLTDALLSQTGSIKQTIFSFLRKLCSAKTFGGWKVTAIEKKLWSSSEDKDYGLYGKLDLVLSDVNGRIAVLDYKTSSVPTIKACNADVENQMLEDFQCAAYVSLWNGNNENTGVDFMSFFSIKDGKQTEILTPDKSDKTSEAYEPTLGVFNRYTDLFTEKVKEKSFEPKRGGKKEIDSIDVLSDCSACEYKTTCRYTYTVAGHDL